MGYVNLSKMPSAKKEYVTSFDMLAGGLNLQELDYRIDNNESPEMKNLLWREGVLSCRDGQVWINSTGLGTFHTAYDRLWNDCMFAHAGNCLYVVEPQTGESYLIYEADGGMSVRGTFFPYNEKLYYKTEGYYIVITYAEPDPQLDDNNEPIEPAWYEYFSADDVEGYVPVTYINCTPANGSGTIYQPENRISSKKTLWYNSAYTMGVTVSGDFTVSLEDSYFRARQNTPGTYVFEYTTEWELDGVPTDPLDYGITVGGTPVNGDAITVVYAWVNRYYLPLTGLDVTNVTVDGVTQTEEKITVSDSEGITATLDKDVWRSAVTVSGSYVFSFVYEDSAWELGGVPVDLIDYGITVSGTIADGSTVAVVYIRGDYYIDDEGASVIFYSAPPVTYPETNNTVHITYSAENPTAYNNIMDCRFVAVYGGTGALCIVVAGSKTQPNAYFWNGQTSISMDASYFPMTQYQLAGDTVDPITGFGKQQGYLIIFKAGSVGRTTLGTETINDRLTIDLPYVGINSKIGCDLPWTIQLVENNLTWCNTVRGVHFLANTSAAYENNVVCLSDKVNDSGSAWNPGMLYDLRSVDPETVCSHDDEKRYWLIARGHAWLWDYFVSRYTSPSWFYFDNINGQAFIQEYDDVWHFDAAGRLTHMERVYYDYDTNTGSIDKVFRFATQFFNTYDNLKNINSVIINTRSDTNSQIHLQYLTDYETREDLTTLNAESWLLVPRDLTYRNLSGSGFAHVFRRKPHCRRVKYFTMRLENNDPLKDMSIVSAQIYYTYQGRQR